MFNKKKKPTKPNAPEVSAVKESPKFGVLVVEITYKNKAKRLENRVVKYEGSAPKLSKLEEVMNNIKETQSTDGPKIERVVMTSFFNVLT